MSPEAGNLLVEHIAPRLRATSRCLPQIGADDADEMYQDALAIAARMLDNAEQNGKQVTAGTIAWYASKQLATGRRSNYSGRTDVLAPSTQLDGNASLAPLQQPIEHDPDTGEGIPLSDLLADTAEDPAATAARNSDWSAFLCGLDDLGRRMIQAFAVGDTMRDLKSIAGLSDSGMSARKRKLAAALKEHFGEGCIADACRAPSWLADITVQREKEAHRHESAVV